MNSHPTSQGNRERRVQRPPYGSTMLPHPIYLMGDSCSGIMRCSYLHAYKMSSLRLPAGSSSNRKGQLAPEDPSWQWKLGPPRWRSTASVQSSGPQGTLWLWRRPTWQGSPGLIWCLCSQQAEGAPNASNEHSSPWGWSVEYILISVCGQI